MLFSMNNYSKGGDGLQAPEHTVGICISILHWYAQRIHTCTAINEIGKDYSEKFLKEMVISGW